MIKIYQDSLLKNGLKFMINRKKNYNANKEIRIETPKLRSALCNFIDAYIVVKGNIIVTNPDNAPFINCIPNINCVQIDNA